ncbi:MAG: TlpA disulfide reductase family protein [Elusimicrobiaceae bacterium]
MRKNTFAVLIALSALLPAAVAGTQDKKTAPAPEKTSAKTVKKPEYIKKDSYFRLPSYKSGEFVDLADMQGKPVLIAFITTTCPYCKLAMSAMKSFYKTYNKKDLQVLTVAFEQDAQRVANFVKTYELPFPVALGDDETSAQFRIRGVPQLYLLDRSHETAGMWMGYNQAYDSSIAGAIDTVLAPKTEPKSAEAAEAKPEKAPASKTN